jgi:hypothetical protein
MLTPKKKDNLSPFIGLFLVLTILMISCNGNTPSAPNGTSAYITRVFDYIYAPGQHALLANKSDTLNFKGEPTNDKGWLYLGGFGGYVVAGFDHNVLNSEGYDFEVYALQGASPEPGVVYVMPDTNKDGLPNDSWYELKGNQFANSRRNYWVRYYKVSGTISNTSWKDSQGSGGELIPGFGSANSASWWWPATIADSITFHGTRLPDSYDNNSSGGTEYWTVPPARFTWGYVKNNNGTDYDATAGANKFDISNAVDSLGNAVNLPEIRFIKVQTGVFQQAGWLNEVSTEVRGAKDLRK